jgi:hypothetical protein
VYLEQTVVPEITKAAWQAGRPAPRIIAGLPILVTDDVDAVRDDVARAYATYNELPSYRRVLDGSGAASAVDVAMLGSEKEVERDLRRLRDIGVTHFVAEIMTIDPEERRRMMEFLASLDL